MLGAMRIRHLLAIAIFGKQVEHIIDSDPTASAPSRSAGRATAVDEEDPADPSTPDRAVTQAASAV
jgi:hypothetical protein